MKVRRPYAFCCIEGGGRVEGCMCSQPEHGYAVVDVRAMLPGDEMAPSDPVRDLIDWARRERAFPIGNPSGEGRGHIDENHRFKLRDMVDAIEAATPAPAVDAVPAGEVDWVAKAAERMASIAAIPDAMIDAALNARVPGGAPVLAWLPMEDGWTPSETARDIIRHALFAALWHGEGRK